MRYLSLSEILKIHRRIIESSGGKSGIRDLGAIESALAQPRVTFSGQDLYPTTTEKAGSLCFYLIANHSFFDGNKRIGHAAIEVFLYLNGYKLAASTDSYANGRFGKKFSVAKPSKLLMSWTFHC